MKNVKYKCEVLPRAEMLYLEGKALNVTSSHNPEAQDALAKAVKLNPRLVEAWNQLGECYWKQGDMQGAHNCFTGALSQQKNKVSLRNLSMVLRQQRKTPDEKLRNIQESVSKARDAVQMDIADGTSWSVLGNAYLSLFFSTNQDSRILKQCMQAYSQAEKDPVANCNPDLHHNRAVMLQYEEDYEASIRGYQRAHDLDPLWPEPQTKLQSLLDYLSKVTELVEQKGRLKGKKLQQLLRSMNAQKDLGPYSGSTYTSGTGASVKLSHVPLKQLNKGLNSGKVILGRVVCSVSSGNNVPFTFCMVDSDATCFSVTLYNLAAGQGVIIGDSVAIPEPILSNVDVEFNSKKYHFWNVRVESPVVLAVNGKMLSKDKLAAPVFSVSILKE
ncbi:PREDICTED: tetratricopeptide repeat protein 5-like [Priapulus caudatus]|uniref:Tetratricopeptide repeat protein 5-like n=1 Tax=Priapulus caudatus TaxID=37621 RepID=A0ABM1DNA9_PRICU|nr:PREDICTED: tetratricopeptide repeat protein 5-like [Priapulus caudatus]